MNIYDRAVADGALGKNEYLKTLQADYDQYKDTNSSSSIASTRAAIVQDTANIEAYQRQIQNFNVNLEGLQNAEDLKTKNTKQFIAAYNSRLEDITNGGLRPANDTSFISYLDQPSTIAPSYSLPAKYVRRGQREFTDALDPILNQEIINRDTTGEPLSTLNFFHQHHDAEGFRDRHKRQYRKLTAQLGDIESNITKRRDTLKDKVAQSEGILAQQQTQLAARKTNLNRMTARLQKRQSIYNQFAGGGIQSNV